MDLDWKFSMKKKKSRFQTYSQTERSFSVPQEIFIIICGKKTVKFIYYLNHFNVHNSITLTWKSSAIAIPRGFFFFQFANCNCVHWMVILHPITLQSLYQSVALAVTILSDRNMWCLCKYAYSNMLRFLLLQKNNETKYRHTHTHTKQNGQIQLEEKDFISAYCSWVTIHCHWQKSRQELKERPSGKN